MPRIPEMKRTVTVPLGILNHVTRLLLASIVKSGIAASRSCDSRVVLIVDTKSQDTVLEQCVYLCGHDSSSLQHFTWFYVLAKYWAGRLVGRGKSGDSSYPLTMMCLCSVSIREQAPRLAHFDLLLQDSTNANFQAPSSPKLKSQHSTPVLTGVLWTKKHVARRRVGRPSFHRPLGEIISESR